MPHINPYFAISTRLSNTTRTVLFEQSAQIKMPPQNSNHRTPRRVSYGPLARRALIDPDDKAYNRVIRLEGQIATLVQIHRFLWRYKVCNRDYTIETDTFADAILAESYAENAAHHSRATFIKDDATFEELKAKRKRQMTDAFLDAGRMVYFDMIEELIDRFLNQGVDLAYEGYNLGSFVGMIKRGYLRWLPRKEREREGLWAKIWWLRRLQEILEDEKLSLSEALVKGWQWFVDPEQWPTTSSGRPEYADMWKQLEAERKRTFLDDFAIDEEKLDAWMSGVSTQGFCCKNVAEEEGEGLQHEFRAAGADFTSELNVPKLAEEALEDGSTCSICGEGYSLENRGTERSHVPVRITPCGHVFGWRCLVTPMENHTGDGRCATCNVRMCGCTSPQDVIDGCDKFLGWLQPPTQLDNTTGPDSYLSRLMLIFKPADEIRRRLRYWVPHASSIAADLSKMGDLGMYQARERLAAVVKKDVSRYRDVVMKQTQATAQRLWLEFLGNVLPQWPAVA
ncbi:hypothetical protein P171DRAFT_427408 [Karstenula rhodostoma CBS 690.94]|uniref:RING-type domain-containing protein n=1 Tax=Karstenula rhodostoma CBS 690.94 TaxID=1392251 RepID=A0A9P4PRW7_9PLEO|nr:hypothetical protein P171DRAFT_427408 [Karstenula rhodostoma CBS 690.94]